MHPLHSAMIVRMYCARGGTSTPMISSIPFVKAVVCEWERIPQTRSIRGRARMKSRCSAAFSIPR